MLQLEKGTVEILAGRYGICIDSLANFKEVVTLLAKEDGFEEALETENSGYLVTPFVSPVDGSVDILIYEDAGDDSELEFRLVSVGDANVLYVIQGFYTDKLDAEIVEVLKVFNSKVLIKTWERMQALKQLAMSETAK